MFTDFSSIVDFQFHSYFENMHAFSCRPHNIGGAKLEGNHCIHITFSLSIEIAKSVVPHMAMKLYNNAKYHSIALGKLGIIVAETLFPANVSPCFQEWANTIGNISKKTWGNIKCF